jgi:hypothetical protein
LDKSLAECTGEQPIQKRKKFVVLILSKHPNRLFLFLTSQVFPR